MMEEEKNYKAKVVDRHNRNLMIIALVLACFTYVYINDSLKKTESRPPDASYRLIKMTAKSVPVKVRFSSSPPQGFKLIPERVTVQPEKITLIGPEALLEETIFAETSIIDTSQATKKFAKAVQLESVGGYQLYGEPYMVEVTVPIDKLEVEGSQ